MKQPELFGPYYNTTNLTGETLSEEKANAKGQEEKIMKLFRERKKLTPSEAWQLYCRLYPAVPITSIRRCFTTMTKNGQLLKTEHMKKGIYGKPEHLWEIK